MNRRIVPPPPGPLSLPSPTSQLKPGDKAGRPPKAPKKKSPRSSVNTQVPLLLDVTLIISKMLIILVGVVTAVLSLLVANVSPLLAVVRSGVAMLAVGVVVWLINWFLARFAIEYAVDELKREIEEQQLQSTLEKQA